jgi:hypothetical protein
MGCRGITLLFLEPRLQKDEGGGLRSRPGRYTPWEKETVPSVQEAEGVPVSAKTVSKMSPHRKYIHLVPCLWSGAIILNPLYDVMAWTSTTLPFPSL